MNRIAKRRNNKLGSPGPKERYPELWGDGEGSALQLAGEWESEEDEKKQWRSRLNQSGRNRITIVVQADWCNGKPQSRALHATRWWHCGERFEAMDCQKTPLVTDSPTTKNGDEKCCGVLQPGVIAPKA